MPDRDDRLTTEDLSGRTQDDAGARERERDERSLGDRLRAGFEELTGPQEREQHDPAGEPAVRQPPAARQEPAAQQQPAAPSGTTADAGRRRDGPLMPPADLEDFRRRWEQVQTDFVDEPRRAVEEADTLVAEAMRRLADIFASERSNLEEQWDRAGEADTEALRVTLQRYRSFFDRLLSA